MTEIEPPAKPIADCFFYYEGRRYKKEVDENGQDESLYSSYEERGCFRCPGTNRYCRAFTGLDFEVDRSFLDES